MVREAIERSSRAHRRATRECVSSQRDKAGQTAITLEIEADMFANPIPEAVFVRTSLDLETGRCSMQEG